MKLQINSPALINSVISARLWLLFCTLNLRKSIMHLEIHYKCNKFHERYTKDEL